jgi:hypothetical protein
MKLVAVGVQDVGAACRDPQQRQVLLRAFAGPRWCDGVHENRQCVCQPELVR